ncbi:MAG: hypothetical protein NVS4B11_22120 [Ktedonobacteraceae bacterium]
MVALAIFCFAFLIRIIYTLTVAKGYVPQYDARSYEAIALHLLKDKCFCITDHIPTVGRAPAWPILIAIIYHIAGPQNLYARYFLCVLGAGTCVLLYLLASTLFNRHIGIFAGIIAALYPGLYIYDGWLYSESMYTFLLFASVYGFSQLQRTAQTRWAVLCGVLLGLLSLTRPNGLAVIVLALVWLLIIGKIYRWPWRNIARSVALLAVISLAIVAPWTIRNYTVAHAFVPVAIGDGTVLAGAYNNRILPESEVQGQWVSALRTNPDIARSYGICNDAVCDTKRDTALKQRAVQWASHHVTMLPYLLGLHFIKMWTPITPEADLPMNQFPHRRTSQFVMTLLETVSIPIFLIAVFGLWATRHKWQDLLFIYFIIAMTIVQCLYFYGSSRFRASIEPIVLLFVVGTLWWVLSKLRNVISSRYVARQA